MKRRGGARKGSGRKLVISYEKHVFIARYLRQAANLTGNQNYAAAAALVEMLTEVERARGAFAVAGPATPSD